MQSKIQRISNKTNDRHPPRSTHFFEPHAKFTNRSELQNRVPGGPPRAETETSGIFGRRNRMRLAVGGRDCQSRRKTARKTTTALPKALAARFVRPVAEPGRSKTAASPEFAVCLALRSRARAARPARFAGRRHRRRKKNIRQLVRAIARSV